MALGRYRPALDKWRPRQGNDNQNRNTAAAVLRGLIWHITARRPQLAIHLVEPLSDEKRAQTTITSRETLWSLFVKLIQHCRSSPIACVLDGLDECDEDSQRWLIAKLVDAHALEFSSGILKLAIVSRPLPGLERISQIRLDPDNEDEVGKDIARFVAARIQELAERVNLPETALRKVESTLLERSEGTFLWVGFAMLELLKKETATEILKTLHTLPQGLDSMYSRMLGQIDDSHKARCSSILQWATLTIRPLTLLELAAATGTKATEHLTQEQVIRDEVHACEALVRIGAETVGLVHQSARDFLLRSEINNTKGHYNLAVCCVEWLEHVEDLGLGHYTDVQAKRKPFDGYSVRFWPSHAKASGALAKGLFRQSRMFGAQSAMRVNWWKEYYDMDRDTVVPAVHIASYLGILPWVQALIKHKKMPLFHEDCSTFHRLVNSRDSKGRSPLWWAELSGNKDTAQLLVANGARRDAQRDVRIAMLVMASLEGEEEVVQGLIAEGIDVDAHVHSAFVGGNALQAASLEGYKATVQLLLAHGADPNVESGYLGNAPQAASYSGHEAIVRLLLERKVDVNVQGGFYRNALQAASHSGHEAIMRLLLAAGADVNAQGGIHYPNALYAASTVGHEEIVQLLLEAGADVNAQGGHYGNALQAASANGNEEKVRLLLAAGADVNAQGGFYENALQAACCFRHEAVVRPLLEHGAVEQWSSDEDGKEAWSNYKKMLKKWDLN
ncbi:hypothetical protein LTR17_020713 [Elasticomyces elasticus]|nr:hypothetical protein LTR17_020713 [Elasticomyces elasticus]